MEIALIGDSDIARWPESLYPSSSGSKGIAFGASGATLSEVLYVNCLLMFCGESGKQRGALFGGRAKAEEKYFDADGLHLSNLGYSVWKEVVEKEIANAL